jgi:hypothetical protein
MARSRAAAGLAAGGSAAPQPPAAIRCPPSMKPALAALLVSLLAAPASAQPAGAPADARDLADQDCARARQANRPCVLSFGEGDLIEGGVKSPLGEVIEPRDLVRFASLIRVRVDFRAEIIRAAEDL